MSIVLNWQAPQDLTLAAAYVRRGGVLAYPTEAIFGLGGHPENTEVIEQIFALKRGRLPEKGMVLVAADWQLCQGFVAGLCRSDMAEMEALNARRATTFIVEAGARAFCALRDGRTNRIAIRISTHPVVAQLSRLLGCPLISTSANLSSQIPAKTAQAVRQYFPQVAILDGALGNEQRPSRIIDWHNRAVLRD